MINDSVDKSGVIQISRLDRFESQSSLRPWVLIFNIFIFKQKYGIVVIHSLIL